MLQEKLTVIMLPVADLKPNPRNARTHSDRQIRQIADSIETFGFTNPILIDKEGQIVGGEGRYRAAKKLGWTEVPTIRIDWLTKEQLRAYVLADNKLALNAGWDQEVLAIELQALLEIDSSILDVTVTGFEVAEIDSILQVSLDDDPANIIPETEDRKPPVTQAGDTWRLGNHRIHCGNALHEASFMAVLRSNRAAAAFTDPPYNVRIDGNATGKGSIHHREFSMASGEMSEAEYVSFLCSFLLNVARFSSSNSVHYICIDWRHVGELLAASKQHYSSLLNICVWVKDNGGMGSFYRSQHELVLVLRKGNGSHRNNVQLGRFGRNRTNVWQYPGIQTQSKQSGEGNLLALHPTVKPVALVVDALLDSTARGEIVLDPFLGSGTTLIAAERVGRICRGIEIDPLYVDVAIRRWQNYTGDAAIHEGNGKRFDEIAAEKETVLG